MRGSYLLNGRLGDALTPWERGFAYGDGVFRTLLARDGIPVNWQRHYRKLHDDCAALGIACPRQEVLLDDIRRLASGDAQAVVKLVVTRGESRRGYAPVPGATPTRVVMKSPLPHYPEEYYTQGVHLYLCQTRLAIQPRLAGIKHLNRLENVLARMEWDDAEHAEGLLLDMSGHVIECTASNVFLREGDNLVTPDLSDCGVAGVTRERILELAVSLGLRPQVGRRTLEELLQADEVLLCNSVFGMWQVRALQQKRWPHSELAARVRQCLLEEDACAD